LTTGGLQDGRVQAAQALSRLDPELLGQALPDPVVRRMRLRTATGSVQRENQLGLEPLVERMLRGQALEARKSVSVPSLRQKRIEPFLLALQPPILQASGLAPDEVLVNDVLVGPASPECQRFVQHRKRVTRPTGGKLAS